jgi:hypothetical protein
MVRQLGTHAKSLRDAVKMYDESKLGTIHRLTAIYTKRMAMEQKKPGAGIMKAYEEQLGYYDQLLEEATILEPRSLEIKQKVPK